MGNLVRMYRHGSESPDELKLVVDGLKNTFKIYASRDGTLVNFNSFVRFLQDMQASRSKGGTYAEMWFNKVFEPLGSDRMLTLECAGDNGPEVVVTNCTPETVVNPAIVQNLSEDWKPKRIACAPEDHQALDLRSRKDAAHRFAASGAVQTYIAGSSQIDEALAHFAVP